MASVKTAYAMAYSRLLLLLKEGKIGQVISVDATCTRIPKDIVSSHGETEAENWNSICAWGPTALLPVLQILGTDYRNLHIVSKFADKENRHDSFTKIDFTYGTSVASIKVADGVKSEGELIISGTNGYAYVPAPWWKTDYFEIRYEDIKKNRRYFYQLDGEGIRYEIVAFVKAVETGKASTNVTMRVAEGISKVIETFYDASSLRELEQYTCHYLTVC